MKDLLPRSNQGVDAMQAEQPVSHTSFFSLKRSVSLCIALGIVLAFASSAVLLLNDIPRAGTALLAHGPVSALPLILIGLTALGFQVIIRPGWLDLFKAFLVSSAFLLWGIDQLLPSGWLATTLGDVVIVLYVIDLGWMMLDRLRAQRKGSGQAG